MPGRHPERCDGRPGIRRIHAHRRGAPVGSDLAVIGDRESPSQIGPHVEVERQLSPGPDAPEPGDAHDRGRRRSVMSRAEALRTDGIIAAHAEQRGCEESRKAS